MFSQGKELIVKISQYILNSDNTVFYFLVVKTMLSHGLKEGAMKIVSIEIERIEQTVQTQSSLILKEQSDEGLHCLPFHHSALLRCKNQTVPFLGQVI